MVGHLEHISNARHQQKKSFLTHTYTVIPLSIPYRGVSIRYKAISRVMPISEQSPGFVIIMTDLGFSHLRRV